MHTVSRSAALQLFIRLVLLVSLLLTSFLTLSKPTAAQTSTFRNPLKQDGADPWIQYYNGNYYFMATTWTSELTMRRSPSIAGLAAATARRVWTDTNPARCCQIWAPEFHLLSGPSGTRWYIYYTAGTAGPACCDGQRQHVLESAGTDPLGPYTYKAQLFPGWAIDGSILKMGSSIYLLYSKWEGADQGVYIAPLSNPWTVSGSSVRLTAPTYSWETIGGRTNEGPAAIYRNGRTFITFSASSCNTPDYKIGLLSYTGTNPMSASSWTKKSTPIFQRSDANGVYGPGHNGFFKSPDGTEDWIVYHANTSTSQGCGSTRSTRAQKITWNSDGSPNLGTPLSLSTNITVPSGDPGAGAIPTRTRTPTPGTSTSYRIVNRNSGKCLDVNAASTLDGGNVQQWTCNGGNNQRWRVEDLGTGYSRIVNVHSGKVLDVNGCGTTDGTNIQQWSWLNNSCQQWRLLTTTSPYFRLENRNSLKVADVASCSTADGANLRQWSWLSNSCQQWQLQP